MRSPFVLALWAAALVVAAACSALGAGEEYLVCSQAYGCCTTSGRACRTAIGQAYTVGADANCQGLPTLQSAGAAGAQISACLLPGVGTCPGGFLQAFSASTGAMSIQDAFVIAAAPSGEWAVSYASGAPMCTTRGGACSAGQATVAIVAATPLCENQPSITWMAVASVTACLPASSSGSAWVQSLAAYRVTGSDRVTVCPA